MNQPICRFGILGAANIARKNWQAIRLAENANLVAVASRNRAKSQQFIDDCQSHVAFPTKPEACGSYEELLDRKDIDAVYIPLPTGIRKEWVIKAAQAGKHILCEKPCAPMLSDLDEMLAACQQNQVQFMDGVMFMHSKRLNLLRSVLDDGKTIGSIKRISSLFSFMASDDFLNQNIRVSNELEPLGALGDLGWYNIRFSLWAMNGQLPEKVIGRILHQHGRSDSTSPVPMEFSGELLYPNGASVGFYCSFLTANQQMATISGTLGHLTLRDFVLPYFGTESGFHSTQAVFSINGCDFNMEDHTKYHGVHEYSNSWSNAQEVNMIRTFADLVTKRQLDSYWPEIAWKTQKVLDNCLRSARAGCAEIVLT